ncbi:MAG: SHOCT domain-containing protein [Gaiellaceae bacterium]
MARRTARRTSRRQAYMHDAMSGGYDEPEPPAAPPAAAAPDYAAELQKLASLRDQGIIDDAEFEAKKKQILGI